MIAIAAKILLHPHPLQILRVFITPTSLLLLLYVVAKFGKDGGRGQVL